MGLGGHLTWTAAIREIHKKYSVGVFPCVMGGNHISSEIFINNPYCVDKDSDYNIHHLRMPLYRYRMHGNNKTTTKEYKKWEI